MSEEKCRTVFDKDSLAEAHDGQGLGLAMCRMAVELHKGRIWVESGAGGNNFIFTVSKNLSSEPAGEKA